MSHLRDAAGNMIAGFRLAVMLPVWRNSFRVSIDQAVVLLLASFMLWLGYSFLMTDAQREFNAYGLSHTAALYLFFLFFIYLVARIQGDPSTAIALLVLMGSAGPLVLSVVALLRWAGETAAERDYDSIARALFLVWAVWLPAVLFRAVRLLYGAGIGRAGALAMLYAAFSIGPLFLLPEQRLWYSTTAGDESSGYARVNVEDTYDAQRDLVDRVIGSLASQRPGATDLYFVGFAGAAYQDVFMKEVRFVRGLFDDRFDTKDRSVMLINNRATVEELPLASASNLRRVLGGIARRVDRDEDVVFVFLTSHGSRDHVLSTRFWPLDLNGLSAAKLKEILDLSKIKWRILVVSACYSGGFIDVLKDENTLIVTAARADRNSFGCSHLNDFTYFGQAYFNEQLRDGFSFVEAFYDARASIAEREQQEGLTPSRPQIHIGAAIEAKLAELEARLRRRAVDQVSSRPSSSN